MVVSAQTCRPGECHSGACPVIYCGQRAQLRRSFQGQFPGLLRAGPKQEGSVDLTLGKGLRQRPVGVWSRPCAALCKHFAASPRGGTQSFFSDLHLRSRLRLLLSVPLPPRGGGGGGEDGGGDHSSQPESLYIETEPL